MEHSPPWRMTVYVNVLDPRSIGKDIANGAENAYQLCFVLSARPTCFMPFCVPRIRCILRLQFGWVCLRRPLSERMCVWHSDDPNGEVPTQAIKAYSRRKDGRFHFHRRRGRAP